MDIVSNLNVVITMSQCGYAEKLTLPTLSYVTFQSSSLVINIHQVHQHCAVDCEAYPAYIGICTE